MMMMMMMMMMDVQLSCCCVYASRSVWGSRRDNATQYERSTRQNQSYNAAHSPNTARWRRRCRFSQVVNLQRSYST